MNTKTLISVLTLTAALLMASAGVVFAQSPDTAAPGAVYTMTNNAAGNEVLIFNRGADGILTSAGKLSTGGNGSGTALDPLGSQGSLRLSKDMRWLLAVNAGSDEISVFEVVPDGLKLVDKVASGGVFPVSVTIFHDLVYVLNAGGSPNITGFKLGKRGDLTPLKESTRMLGAGGFAQVGFDPRGVTLVITDKMNNSILVYAIDNRGLPGISPVISPSSGLVPFGLIFDRMGTLLVVEAGTNAVSSYKILDDLTLKVINASVPNGQIAACWIVGTDRGFVFTANPGTHTISSYKHGRGSLVLLNGAAGAGNTPLDITIVDGKYLYALDPAGGAIDAFKIEEDGGLTGLGTVAGEISVFAQGIAAR